MFNDQGRKTNDEIIIINPSTLPSRLEHPNKLLHSIFEKLYDNDVVSEDGFQVRNSATKTKLM